MWMRLACLACGLVCLGVAYACYSSVTADPDLSALERPLAIGLGVLFVGFGAYMLVLSALGRRESVRRVVRAFVGTD